MDYKWLVIDQLDQQFKEWQKVSKKYSRPQKGWVKTLRSALGMSAEELADRLGVKRSRVAQLEKAEVHDAVTLRTIREAAEAMGCEFVYVFLPKKANSLTEIIKERAEQVASESIQTVAHSMSLEAQTVRAPQLKKQKEELAKNLLRHFNKNLWTTKKKSNFQVKQIDIAVKKNPEKKNRNSDDEI